MTPVRPILRALILVVLCSAGLRAQAPATTPAKKDSAAARDPHTAQPERPTVATHAGTVARGWVEVEAGVEADRGPGDASNHITTIVTKIGVGSHAQLSVAVNGATPDGGRTGFGDLGVGLKMRLFDDHPLLGDFAIQPALKLPTGSASRGTGTGTTDASLLLISSRDAGPVHIDLNVGYTVRSTGAAAPPNQWVWTASFGGMVAGKAGWTAELYGYPGSGGNASQVGLLFGPTLAVYNSFVLDIGAIVPVTNAQPHAVYVGATYNIGRVF